jgi:hypothetical protein
MCPVRRRLVYLIAWAAATTVTVGVAWWGIRSVLVAAAPSRITPLSAADLRNAAPKVTSLPAPSPSPSVTSAAPPAGATTPAKPPPSDAWVPVGSAFRRTFHTDGGDVVVLAADNNVKIESTKPKPGFQVTVQRQNAESVVVSFIGPRKSSRLWARWNNGPYAEVTEVTGFTT